MLIAGFRPRSYSLSIFTPTGYFLISTGSKRSLIKIKSEINIEIQLNSFAYVINTIITRELKFLSILSLS